jgi:K+-sensing histidine kinase KdpD
LDEPHDVSQNHKNHTPYSPLPDNKTFINRNHITPSMADYRKLSAEEITGLTRKLRLPTPLKIGFSVLEQHANDPVKVRSIATVLDRKGATMNMRVEHSLQGLQGTPEQMSSISHSLRTPLTGILGFIELLSYRSIDQETAKDWIDTITGYVQQYKENLGKLHTFWAYDAGIRVPNTGQNFNLRQMVHGVTARYARAHQTCNFHVSVEKVKVTGDREALARATYELIDNGRRFSPEESDVYIAGNLNGNQLEISVTDKGVGASSIASLGQYGTPYHHENHNLIDGHQMIGPAVGLATAKMIATAHHGEIVLESLGTDRGLTARLVVSQRQ